MEDLQSKRRRFTRNLAKLILHVESLGYQAELGEVYLPVADGHRLPVHKDDMYHYLGLAAKLHIYQRNGYHVSHKPTYQQIATYWKTLHHTNGWGADNAASAGQNVADHPLGYTDNMYTFEARL